MTDNPLRVAMGSMMVDAVAVLAERKISELPVVDADGKPAGLIDITDVVALLPPVVESRVLRIESRAEGGGRKAEILHLSALRLPPSSLTADPCPPSPDP